jgi:hypothetical protein
MTENRVRVLPAEAAGDQPGNTDGNSVFQQARRWVGADRYRIFLALSAVALVACIALLVLPGSLATVGLAFVFAGLAALLGLLSLATWWAGARGLTDGHNLWDDDHETQADRPEDVLRGFSEFHTYDK